MPDLGAIDAQIREALARDAQILDERIQGASTPDIGARHGLTSQRVGQIVLQQTKRHVDELERMLVDEGVALAIPPLIDPDQLATVLNHHVWCIRKLLDRGHRLVAVNRALPGGQVVLGLFIDTNNSEEP